ncbi:hypothetical protein Pmani_030910 [Petrolisthes manimaculis]|uniref:Uncharacterized protein n=1 Tax=Petrolisthes manimaculis TaxID=1843537 RepID=A0AAE1TT11_9EUCA|nr:hypothetical protein Pmani_030910 [Petrolisthes manimaculis]
MGRWSEEVEVEVEVEVCLAAGVRQRDSQEEEFCLYGQMTIRIKKDSTVSPHDGRQMLKSGGGNGFGGVL